MEKIAQKNRSREISEKKIDEDVMTSIKCCFFIFLLRETILSDLAQTIYFVVPTKKLQFLHFFTVILLKFNAIDATTKQTNKSSIFVVSDLKSTFNNILLFVLRKFAF